MAAISYYLTEKRSELKVNSLKLKNFRNYDLLNVEFDGSTNIFYGNNAQGKTNILEAVYLSGTTKSHRGSKDRDMIRFGEDESHIETVVEKNTRFTIPKSSLAFRIGILFIAIPFGLFFFRCMSI